MSPNIENLTNFKHKNVVATDYDTHNKILRKKRKNLKTCNFKHNLKAHVQIVYLVLFY